VPRHLFLPSTGPPISGAGPDRARLVAYIGDRSRTTGDGGPSDTRAIEVFEGEPGTFEYCATGPAAETYDEGYEPSSNSTSPSSDDAPVYEPPATTVTTTYAESPAGITEAEREQAAVDTRFQDYVDAWNEWNAAYDDWSTEAWATNNAAWEDYNAGFDAQGNPPGPEPVDPDEDAWRADHPEPVEPSCSSRLPPGE
jgi:hypothetical protein